MAMIATKNIDKLTKEKQTTTFMPNLTNFQCEKRNSCRNEFHPSFLAHRNIIVARFEFMDVATEHDFPRKQKTEVCIRPMYK